MTQAVTVHMIVKNEDQWLFYALNSVLPYATQILLTDTGSTDHTLELIKSISSPKITFSQASLHSPTELTMLRNEHIKKTKTPWLWIVDGDEIYSQETAEEIVSQLSSSNKGIAVRRNDLLGDIYHRQIESVGQYQLLGTKGHLVTRLINMSKFPSLHVERPYPLEAYLDQAGRVVHSYDQDQWYITENYLYHAMYLRRSSLGAKLPMFNRAKFKIETGIKVASNPPSVFSLPRPSYISDPLRKRTLSYELAASLITPIKNLKRKFL